MSVPGVFEMAPGADPAADPATYTWVDLTARTQNKAMVIARGRSSSSAAFVEPTRATVPLSASTSDAQTDSLVAYQARSQWYPNIRRGLTCRYYINTGAAFLLLDGTSGCRLATADKATLDIVGDIYIAVQFRSPIVFPARAATNMQVVGKHNGTGNQRSWMLELNEFGIPALFWSTTGADFPSLAGAMPLPRPDLGDLTLGLRLDVNNGAGGHDLYLWAYRGTISELNAALAINEARWRLGPVVTGSGVTSIFNSTAPLEIGDISSSSGTPYPGGINALEVRSTNWAGTVAANPDMTIQTVGDTSFADTAPTPNTWATAGGAVLSDRKIRLHGTLAANELTLPGHGIEGTGQVTWSILGPLHRLRINNPPLESALFSRIAAAENAGLVDAYWPMEEGRDATSFYSPTTGQPRISTLSGFSFGADDATPASKPLPTVAASQPWGFDVAVPSSTSGEWEVTWLVKVEEPPAVTTPIMVIGANGTARRWTISINTTQIIVVAVDSDGGGLELSATSWDTALEYLSLVSLEVIQNGGDVDWVRTWIPLDGPSAGIAFSNVGSFTATCGRVTRLSNLASAAPPSGLTMGHLVATSGAEIGWLASADQAHAGEAGAYRAARLCRQFDQRILIDGAYTPNDVVGGGPDFALNSAAGEIALGPQPIGTLVDALEDAATSAGAILGEATETDALTWVSRWKLNNQDPAFTSTATVQPFAPVDDTRDVVNDGTVTSAAGSSGRYVDTDHQALEGQIPATRRRNVHHDHDLDGLAAEVVHHGTVEELRYPAFTVAIGKDTATLADPWLALTIGRMFAATDLPAVLPESSVQQLLDGYTETVGPGAVWAANLTGHPATPYRVHVLNDDVYGKLDSAGSELNSSFVAGTATSMSVLVTSGAGWTTDAGEFPFDLFVAGAQVTVTAIGAIAAGVQTFTVSATIANGVTKTIPAGTRVGLWKPAVLAP